MIPERLRNILAGLRKETWVQSLLQKGEVFVVGGTVRDAYRDEDIKDIDMVVEGPNIAQIKDILKYFGRVEEVGESFAVLKFRPKDHEGEDFDIAVPRVDTKIGDGHKGFEVQTDGVILEDDLNRRDFTINSIAVNVSNDDLVDPFDGVLDIELGVIRATDVNAFAEDPLRILRGIQFASRFIYYIDEETMDLMKKHAPEIKDISGERIFDEFMKVINKYGDTQMAMDLLHETGVDEALFGKKMLHYEEGMGHLDPISFFWILGILADIDPAEFVKKRLKGDNKLVKNIKTLDQMFEMLPRIIEEEDLLFMLSKAFTKAPDIMDAVIIPDEVDDIVLKMRLQKIPRGMIDVSINGDDIISMTDNKLPGEEIGFFLETILRDALMNRFEWRDREKSLVYLQNLLYK